MRLSPSMNLVQNPVLGRMLFLPLFVWIAIAPPVIAQAPRQAATVQPTSNAVLDGDGYLLGPGDRVKVDVFNVQEFSGEYTVLPNGSLNLPLIGAVKVQGRTLGQAESAIAARYRAVLQQPVITVGLLAPRPIRVAIAGEVNRPGTYTVPAISTDGNVPSLSRTIQLAEGVTQAADLRQVQIRRLRPVGNAATEVIQVDLWNLLREGNLQQDVRLQDGDSIVIPATTAVNLQEAQQLAAANFAARNNRPLKITVVGEVNRPGPYTLLEGAVGQPNQLINPNLLQVPSVTRAIQVAGGITQLADIRNIQVRRVTRLGPPQVIQLDFWKLLQAGDGLQDLPLQDGDTIQIPTATTTLNEAELTALGTASFSPDRITVNIAGEVERPGAISLQPNAPLNQAILAAGGFNRSAIKRSVTLIRLNPNGTVTRQEVPINFEQGLNAQGNPGLRNNDIIIVRKSGFSNFLDRTGQILGPFTGLINLFRLFAP